MTTINIVTPIQQKGTADSYDIIVEINGKIFRIHFAISHADPCILVSIYNGSDLNSTKDEMVLTLAYETKMHLLEARDITDYKSYIDNSERVIYEAVAEDKFNQLMGTDVTMAELNDFISEQLPSDYWETMESTTGTVTWEEAHEEKAQREKKS